MYQKYSVIFAQIFFVYVKRKYSFRADTFNPNLVFN